MPKLSPAEVRAKELYKQYGTKANVARQMLDEGYSASEISKAVPMSYSQVHSINQKLQSVERAVTKVLPAKAPKAEPMQETVVRLATTDPRFRTIQQRNADRRQLAEAQKLLKPKAGASKVGKLRLPGLPSDVAAGACLNCGFELVVRSTPQGYVIVHTGASAEEYLATVQFCIAVPASLVP